MLGSDVMRGYNDMLILCLLCEEDSDGYAISREIQRRSGGERPIRRRTTTPYSAFGRLEKQGCIRVLSRQRNAGLAAHSITPSQRKDAAPMPQIVCGMARASNRGTDSFCKGANMGNGKRFVTI